MCARPSARARRAPSAEARPLAPLVELLACSKSFGATRALERVDFDVQAGEVHVLAGENGAGKSTLIRILSGDHTDYGGTLKVAGRLARFREPGDATRAGIATIHQELSLVGPMSLTDNLLAGSDPGWVLGLLDPRQRKRLATEILHRAGLDLDPSLPVEELSLAERQLVEIARALARDASVIVMDEPTSALTEQEASTLFDRIDELREQGKGMVYISHRMEEIYRVADRITVLRDGQRIRTARADELSPEQLIEEIAGRSVAPAARPAPATPAEPALVARDLTLPDALRPGRLRLAGVSLEVHAGEVLGVAGLRGSGTSELLHGLFGGRGSSLQGRIEMGGHPVALTSPAAALSERVMLLAADRGHSVIGEMSVAHNTTLSSLERLSRLGWISAARERSTVAAMMDRLGVVAASAAAPARTLSGGNQQKVAMGRCLLTKPRVLLLDEPTRGIDVGAKSDIYQLIGELSAQGVAVLLVASELDELVELCHRVLVLRDGRRVALLEAAELTRERVLAACMGGDVEAAS